MADKHKRLELIKKLEARRGSRVVAYITGDRQGGLETRIGMDVFPFFYDVLAHLGGTSERIDLFLYSTGGATMAAWGLVNLLREFCSKLSILVPFKAHSSGTLIALGADEIVMTRTGQLSPVDPAITSPYNPVLPNQQPGMPPQFLPVSVEDVLGFLELVRKGAEVKAEDNVTELLKQLATDVRPLALGSVYRAKEQIRSLSQKLLGFHMGHNEKTKIDSIVTALTREFYSHDYLIGRREAKDVLQLKITDCPEDLEVMLMDLFLAYSDEMELNTQYNQDVTLGTQTTRVATFDRAFIESSERGFVFRTKREIKRVRITRESIPLDVFQERTLEEGWNPVK